MTQFAALTRVSRENTEQWATSFKAQEEARIV